MWEEMINQYDSKKEKSFENTHKLHKNSNIKQILNIKKKFKY